MKERTLKSKNRDQGGFITLLALVIMGFIMGLAQAYLTAGSKEVDVTSYLLSGNKARMAAHAGVRLAAGILVKDAADGSTIDHLGENWYLVTRQPDGTSVPYAVDGSSAGVYFDVLVIDLSGRFKANATTDATATTMIERAPYYTAAMASSATANNYWTLPEYALISGLGNARVTYLSPYGTDYKININTADVRDDIVSGDPPDIINALLKLTLTTSLANTRARQTLRYRRGGAAAADGASTPTAEDPSDKDNSPAVIFDAYGDWKTAATSFTNTTCNSIQQNAIDWVDATYARYSSEGFFLVKSMGWVVKDPAGGSGGEREAQYQVMRVIRRTASGYQDCANREWYYEQPDLAPYLPDGSYDLENTFYLYDSP